jgi:hypothetical protein
MAPKNQEMIMRGHGYLSAPEVAERIGLTRIAVLHHAESHGVPTQRAGRHWYIDAHALAATYADSEIISGLITAGLPPPKAIETPKKRKAR